MKRNWRRPILVGGIGLSLAIWMLERLQQSANALSEWALVGALTVSGGLWLYQKTTKKIQLSQENPPLNRQTVEIALAKAEAAINHLQAETATLKSTASKTIAIACEKMRQQATQLKTELNRKELRLAVTGAKAAGKTSLIQVLQSNWVSQLPHPVSLTETPPLFAAAASENSAVAQKETIEIALASDLILFLTSGDLTEPEFQILQQFTDSNTRTVLIWNKLDQYLPEEKTTLLQQLRYRLKEILSEKDIIAIAAAPSPIKVRQYKSDGSLQERLEKPAPEINELTHRLNEIIEKERQQLVLASSERSARALLIEAKATLNKIRRERAIPIIEQYQWIAAAATFTNPVPALDLLATAAVNAQLVADLGAIYQQKFSLQQAQTVAGILGNLILKLGFVELSTQAITSILKSNAITFVAGGVVQGISAAYLTRIAGLSLIEYFQTQEITVSNAWNIEKLGEIMQKVFQQNQRLIFLQEFVKQAREHILPESLQNKLHSEKVV